MNATQHNYWSKRSKHVVLACCVLFVGALSTQARAEANISIMPLGDSLTWGWDGNGADLNTIDTGGYRSPLYLALGAKGVNVTFVGSSKGNPSPVLTAAGQTAMDGYNGYRIDDISNNLAASVAPSNNLGSNSGGFWLTSVAQPNIILLQIGANDIEQGYDPLFTGAGTETDAQFAADTTTRLGNLINQIKTYDPKTTLLVDATPELLNGGKLSDTSLTYATDVQAMVASQYQGKGVFYVDMNLALSVAGGAKFYVGDGVHLTEAGYTVMGDAWSTAIINDYNFANVDTVPEPSTFVLLLGGAAGLLYLGRGRAAKSKKSSA